MVEDFEGYSETEIEALKSLGLIDSDLVDKKVEALKDNKNTEREVVKRAPNITVVKNRGNYLDVDLGEVEFFGGEKEYLNFIFRECHNPKNEGMIVRGNYKTITYLQKFDDIFGDHLYEQL